MFRCRILINKKFNDSNQNKFLWLVKIGKGPSAETFSLRQLLIDKNYLLSFFSVTFSFMSLHSTLWTMYDEIYWELYSSQATQQYWYAPSLRVSECQNLTYMWIVQARSRDMIHPMSMRVGYLHSDILNDCKNATRISLAESRHATWLSKLACISHSDILTPYLHS